MQSNLVNFIQVLRSNNVRVSPAETLDAMDVATTLGYADRNLLRDGLAMTLAMAGLMAQGRTVIDGAEPNTLSLKLQERFDVDHETAERDVLEVRPGATFLDLIARQILSLRENTASRVPLLLMNSFRTRADSLAALEEHPASRVPADSSSGLFTASSSSVSPSG